MTKSAKRARDDLYYYDRTLPGRGSLNCHQHEALVMLAIDQGLPLVADRYGREPRRRRRHIPATTSKAISSRTTPFGCSGWNTGAERRHVRPGAAPRAGRRTSRPSQPILPDRFHRLKKGVREFSRLSRWASRRTGQTSADSTQVRLRFGRRATSTAGSRWHRARGLTPACGGKPYISS